MYSLIRNISQFKWLTIFTAGTLPVIYEKSKLNSKNRSPVAVKVIYPLEGQATKKKDVCTRSTWRASSIWDQMKASTHLTGFVPMVTHTTDSRCSWRQVYHDFFTDIIPSLKASLRLHRISSGIKLRFLKESLRRCFSTPSCLPKTCNISDNAMLERSLRRSLDGSATEMRADAATTATQIYWP